MLPVVFLVPVLVIIIILVIPRVTHDPRVYRLVELRSRDQVRYAVEWKWSWSSVVRDSLRFENLQDATLYFNRATHPSVSIAPGLVRVFIDGTPITASTKDAEGCLEEVLSKVFWTENVIKEKNL